MRKVSPQAAQQAAVALRKAAVAHFALLLLYNEMYRVHKGGLLGPFFRNCRDTEDSMVLGAASTQAAISKRLKNDRAHQ